MNDYILTIIIPHFNNSNILGKLLESIPWQQSFEIIVIDDKSDKHHLDRVKKLKDKYDFKFLTNKTENKGAGTARNLGLEKASGKWILFADSDDYLTDSFYDEVSQYFSSEDDVIFFGATSIYLDTNEKADRHNNIVNILKRFKKEESLKNELMLRYKLPGPVCKLIKRDFIEKNKIKFDEVLISDDVMFSTKVGYYMEKYTVSESVIYVITRGRGSLTTNINEKFFEIKLNTILKYNAFLKRKLCKNDIKLLNLSGVGRTYLLQSANYGLKKFLKVFYLLHRHGIGFFHFKLLNPFHIAKKTIHNRKKKQTDSKYITKS